jgi:hypothetical protein
MMAAVVVGLYELRIGLRPEQLESSVRSSVLALCINSI